MNSCLEGMVKNLAEKAYPPGHIISTPVSFIMFNTTIRDFTESHWR